MGGESVLNCDKYERREKGRALPVSNRKGSSRDPTLVNSGRSRLIGSRPGFRGFPLNRY